MTKRKRILKVSSKVHYIGNQIITSHTDLDMAELKKQKRETIQAIEEKLTPRNPHSC